MKTKKDVLETFKRFGIYKDVYCYECPFDMGFCEKCIIARNLTKLTMFEQIDSDVENILNLEGINNERN